MLDTYLVYGLLAVAGWIAGTVLAVVIDRLPVRLLRTWTVDAYEQTGQQAQADAMREQPGPELLDWSAVLTRIRGHVPNRSGPSGTVRRCRIVEAVSALLWVLTASTIGTGWVLVPALVLASTLTVLAFIDLEHCMLPDQITVPLIFLGLLVNTEAMFAPSLASAVWGAVAGYLALWWIRTAFKVITGKPEAVGLGDCKLLAMLGAWTGIELLGQTVAIGSACCIIYLILHQVRGSRPAGRRLAFGPWLASGGLCSFYWGNLFSLL